MLSLVVGELLDYPRVEEDISDVIACLLISVEHVLNKVNARIAYSGPNRTRKVDVLGQDALFDFVDSLT